MMKDDRIWNLIGRQLAAEATTEELAEIDQWRELHPDNEKIYRAICEYWNSRSAIPASSGRQMWNVLEQRIHQQEHQEEQTKQHQTFYLSKIFKVAAVITLLLVAGWIFTQSSKQFFVKTAAKVEVTPKGKKAKISLPDGSRVWLNADSKLSYAEDFGEEKRELFLSGEAFFEVVKNPDLPFMIHVDKAMVQVLGTSFNVKSYSTDETIETSVVTGEVAFLKKKNSAPAEDTTYYLTPNQKLTFSRISGQVETRQVDSREDIAWIQGKLIFKNASWDKIAGTLERNFNTHIDFENPSLKNCRLTATFQNKTLTEILELISLTQEFDFRKEQKRIVVQGKGCN